MQENLLKRMEGAEGHVNVREGGCRTLAREIGDMDDVGTGPVVQCEEQRMNDVVVRS